jgi:hypothetical protein
MRNGRAYRRGLLIPAALNCCEPIAPSVDAEVIARVEAANPGTLANMIAGFDEEITRRK